MTLSIILSSKKIILKNEETEEYKKHQPLIQCFRDFQKNQDIQKELSISRETFNQRQKKLFLFLLKLTPEIEKLAKDFNLSLNLSKCVYPEWITIVKKMILFLNNNISSTEYVFKKDIYIAEKSLFNKRSVNSSIYDGIRSFDKNIVSLQSLSKKLNCNTKKLKETLLNPFNNEFVVVNDYVSDKNNIKRALQDYLVETKDNDLKGLYMSFIKSYDLRAKEKKINTYLKFLKFIDIEEDYIPNIKTLKPEKIKEIFSEIKSILKKNKLKSFSIDYIVNELNVNKKDIISRDTIISLLGVYKIYTPSKEYVYRLAEEKEKRNNESVIRTIMSRNSSTIIKIIENDLPNYGRSIKSKDIIKKHFLSIIKKKKEE
ncbi:hypothetical protein [Poseidonibacter ostreae]|uniref:Uncharacterized protein n=1 Tax=Poseidonibacter ostreae TaxID=2654171 RepID=A0A6L4WWV3_9BACT|nr:hypothetical protein [Poseidonibacter ostreae]KAB7891339.1 hypothetical protein GBG19_00450 [Poseidonibacter ostreae]